MTVDRDEASALLADVAGMEQRTKEFLTYTKVSQSFFLWGAIWFAGYAASHYFKNQAGWIWLGLNLFGIVASVAMAARLKTRGRGFRWQIPATVLTFIGFGALWLNLGHFGWREQTAFWPTFFSFALMLFGMWVGRAFMVAAAVLTALTLTGYWVSGDFYDIWMAVVGGGSLIGIGLWLRS
jgi:hypothetical protein